MLPGGITGFWDRSNKPLTMTDVRAFRGHCHEAARRTGGLVMSFTDPNPGGVSRNFAVGTLVIPAGEVAILLNAYHPVLAFADPAVEGEVLMRFRDCPELAEAFGLFKIYEVVPATVLEQPLTADALRKLLEFEREQVAYWMPRRVGDVIFNHWD